MRKKIEIVEHVIDDFQNNIFILRNYRIVTVFAGIFFVTDKSRQVHRVYHGLEFLAVEDRCFLKAWCHANSHGHPELIYEGGRGWHLRQNIN